MIKSKYQTKADPDILKIASEYVKRLEAEQVPLVQVTGLQRQPASISYIRECYRSGVKK